MNSKLTRRAVISGLAFMAASNASAQEQFGTPLIIRPEIEGVDPRYAAYASSGPYVHPASPFTIRGSVGDIVIFHPRGANKARLVVFSHGALADPLTYRDLIWHWVTHGFVVAAPLHSDAVIENGPTLRVTEAGQVSKWPVSALLEDPAAWQERVDACRSCLDELEAIRSATGIELELDRPVISGHGYGAYVAQLLLGTRVNVGEGQKLAFRDPRFFAGIVMSPQGPGIMGLDQRSWEEMSAPTLFLVAENDVDFTGQPSDEKSKSYLLSKPGYKHIGFLKSGSSNTFAGQLARTNRNEAKLFEVTKAMTACFLKAYGDYDTKAFEDLTTNFFERMSLQAVDEGRR